MSKPNQRGSLFDYLNHVNNKNSKFYHDLPADEQKLVQPLLLQRGLSGTAAPGQIVILNEYVNPYVFSLHKYTGLLVALLTISVTNKGGSTKWIKPRGKLMSPTPTVIKLIQRKYKYNTRDAQNVLCLLSDEDILDIAGEYGYQTDQIRAIKAELKKR